LVLGLANRTWKFQALSDSQRKPSEVSCPGKEVRLD
jgi:hypothetical protein